MISIAICDDEEYFRTKEKQLILNYMSKKDCACQIDTFVSGKALLKLKESLSNYHIIFLDINMEEMDGIETATKIRNIAKDICLVFVTAFITYAPEGYKVNAIRYLLKDDESFENAINECLDTILKKIDYETKDIYFDFQEGRTKVCLENIIYVESNLHKLIFHIANEDVTEYTLYTKLDNIDELFLNNSFCRIHKSYLVNLRYVESVTRYSAMLSTGESLSISKARYLDTRNEFACYRGDF